MAPCGLASDRPSYRLKELTMRVCLSICMLLKRTHRGGVIDTRGIFLSLRVGDPYTWTYSYPEDGSWIAEPPGGSSKL